MTSSATKTLDIVLYCDDSQLTVSLSTFLSLKSTVAGIMVFATRTSFSTIF